MNILNKRGVIVMKKILFVMLLLSVVSCASMLQRKEMIMFTETEKDFGLQSSKAIGLDFSYDFDVEYYCFYSTGAIAGSGDAKRNEDESKVSALIEKTDKDMLYSFYSKVYENYYATLYRKRHYEKTKNWGGYNYTVKTIIPATEYYLYISEQALSKKTPDIKKHLDDSKEKIKKKAVIAQMEKLSVPDEF